ncbi:MAG: hypothetical protein IKD73_10595 [Selenomonadaceae bacterium]|nr:hypothetical protein [Selenomonadaceae bacterium]
MPRDLQAQKILAEDKNNPAIPYYFLPAGLKAMFNSSRTYGLFTAYFDEELYHYAIDNNIINYVISVVGVTRVLEDVEISQRNHSQYQDLKRFLKQDFTTIHKNIQISDKLKPYITSRIAIQPQSTEGDFKIISFSDEKARMIQVNWIPNRGKSYTFLSHVDKLELVAKATVDGQIFLVLSGMWVPDPKDKSKLIPYWIDYTKLIVNEETILNNLTPTWYSKPYVYKMNVKADEEIKIQVEWLPHKSDA